MSALLQLLTGPEWSQVVKTLLHSLWQGALIAVALALAMQRVVNPHWRYRFSLAALAAIPVAGIITWAALNASNRPLPIVASPPVIAETTTPSAALSPNPHAKVVLLANHSPAPPVTHWTAWLALLWVVGAVAMLGRTGIKLAGAEQLRRSCRPLENAQVTQLLAEASRAIGLVRKIRVAVTDKLTSPAVVGVMIPTLILPLSLVTTLAPEQIRFILLHELAHIRRGDYFANLFQLFVEALLFFNPAVWWISHQVRREREACCDALAIELSGAPTDYARTLIHVAENALEPAPAVAPAFGGEREPSSLADRVQRLLVPGYRPSLRLTWRAMIGAFVLGATLLLLSAEGTRVAVAQITRPQPKAEQDNSNDTTADGAADSTGLSPLAEMVDRFAINDLITVKFSGTIDSIPQHEERIKGDGSITLTLIGAVIAAGKTPAELQKEIHDRYVPAYYKRLAVIVTGEESVSFVGGRVPVRRVYRGATSPAKASQSSGVFEQFTNRRAVGLTQAGKPKTEVAQQSSESHRYLQSTGWLFAPHTLFGSDLLAPGESQLDRQRVWQRTDRIDPFREVEFNLSPRSAQPAPPARTAIVLTSGNSTVLIDPYNPGGMNSWTVDGQNQLYKQWFWYRVDKTNAPGSEASGRIESLAQPINRRSPLDHPSHRPNSIEVSGANDKSRIEHDLADGKTVVKNGGIVRFNDTTIRADSIQVNQKTGDLVASGNVRLEQPGRTYTATKLQLNIYSNSPPARVSTERSNIIYSSEKRRAILAKLKGILLDRIYFNATPLTSVIGELQTQSWRRASDGLGIPIVFGDFGILSAIRDESAEIRVTIIPPLTNVTLMDALDAVVKGASEPIKFSIEENAVVVSLKGQEPDPLFVREFKVKPILFANWLAENGFPITEPSGTTNSARIAESIRGFLAKAGIALDPMLGKSIYYSDKKGNLFVRATKEELDGVEKLVIQINRPELKINVKTHLFEASFIELEAFLPDLVATGDQPWAGILSKSQLSRVWQYLQTGRSVSLLSEGEVTTASGRQAQIQTVEMKTIVTGINPSALAPPGISTNSESLFITTNLFFGPTIDIVPTIAPDGDAVAMTVIPTITEFLGYDGIEYPTNIAVVHVNGKNEKAPLPLPRLRMRQLTNNTVVPDGMTLLLAFPPAQTTTTTKAKLPLLGNIPGIGRFFQSQSSRTWTNILFVLVTPTIVDPAAKQPDTAATSRHEDGESFVTSTNLRPVIDYYEPRLFPLRGN